MKKRSVNLDGHSTSLSLEEDFWEALKEIAAKKGIPLRALISEIDRLHSGATRNLSSALRIFALNYYRGR